MSDTAPFAMPCAECMAKRHDHCPDDLGADPSCPCGMADHAPIVVDLFDEVLCLRIEVESLKRAAKRRARAARYVRPAPLPNPSAPGSM